MNPYQSPQGFPLAEQSGEIDPELYAAVKKINKLTSGITWGLLISIFILIGMVVVVGLAIAALIKANKLYKSAPRLLNLKTYCGAQNRAETKAMISVNPVLKPYPNSPRRGSSSFFRLSTSVEPSC